MRVYYGWVIVGISMVVLMLIFGTTMNTFGLFVLPVSEDFGLSRANVNTGIILTNLGMAVASPVVGRMLDTVSTRWIMAGSAVLFGGSMIALGLSHSIWLSAVVLAIPLALGIAGVGTLTSVALVARWFEAQRGRAMAIAAMGMSLGTIVMAPLVGMMIETIGWRQCLIVLGGVLGVLFLLLVPFIRQKPGPEDIGPHPANAEGNAERVNAGSVSDKPLGIGQILNMPVFWLMALSAALAFGALQAIMISIVPLAQESGVSAPRSAALLSIVGACAIVGKLVLVWFADRLDRTQALAFLFSVVSLTSIALMSGSSYVILAGSAALLGLGAGATMPIFLALLADRVGAASFGTAHGIATLMIALMGSVAIRYGGEVYDRTGGYDVMFLTFVAVGVLSVFLMFVSGRITHIRPAVLDPA